MTGTKITIVITTRNRSANLDSTLCELRNLKPGNWEVTVIDDGSTDRTSEVLNKHARGIRTIRHDQRGGYIRRRNEAAREATGEIIVSLDDDSYFMDSDALETTAAIFQRYPDVGAMAFNIFDESRTPSARQYDLTTLRLCRRFVGCGYAIRRSLFLHLGGFREFYVYGDEERELCLRLMAHGFYILKANSIRVYHERTPIERCDRIAAVYLLRNQLCTTWLNEPAARAIVHTMVILSKAHTLCSLAGLVALYVRAIFSFCGVLPLLAHQRQPVPRRTLRLYDKLRSQDPEVADSSAAAIAEKLLNTEIETT